LEDGSKDNGNVYAEVTFRFNPALCRTDCSCNEVAYVQMIRIINQNAIEGEDPFFQPTMYQRQRMVLSRNVPELNGWAIDRNETKSRKLFGYYGILNDGKPGNTLKYGSNTSDAWIEDRPWISHIGGFDPVSFEAVSVPVCRDKDATCVNCLLGYYWWGFDVDRDAKSSGLADDDAMDIHRDAMDEAIKEWNRAAERPENIGPVETSAALPLVAVTVCPQNRAAGSHPRSHVVPLGKTRR
jgi:hypothetical protein